MSDLSRSPKRTKLVGEFIKKRREALRMSQKELGSHFSPPVTTQFISNIERGVTPLPPAHVAVLAKALSVSDADFMALLEREYAVKLNGRLGRFDEEGQSRAGNETPTLVISSTDYDFMKNLYDAYLGADAKTKEAFATVCESILKLPKSVLYSKGSQSSDSSHSPKLD